MKNCFKCKISKDSNEFNSDKSRKDGLNPYCIPCDRKYKAKWARDNKSKAKKWKKENKEKVAEIKNKYVRNNKEKVKESKRKWAILNPNSGKEWKTNNPEKVKAIKKKWRMNNQHKKNANYAGYRATKANATPLWLTTIQKLEMETIYKEARIISNRTGIKHHVDHIIPIRGKGVTGLHVPWNLQIISAKENMSKSNKI